MILSLVLHERIAAIAPIIGVSFGSNQDKSTWRIDFKPEATAKQRAAAQRVIDDFDTAWESREEADPKAWMGPAKQRIVQALLDDPEAQQLSKAEWMDLLVVAGVITYERQRDGSMNWKAV